MRYLGAAMRFFALLAPALLLTAPTFAQSADNASTTDGAQKQAQTQETQARGYWIDPSTGLMWAGKDNGKDVSWKNAVKYCRDLRLAGSSDWRLPTIDELQGIYDGSGFAVPPPRKGIEWGRAKGGLFLTGSREWSSSRVLDDRGRNSGYAWEYDFPHGRRWKDPLGYTGSLRALCVRGSGK